MKRQVKRIEALGGIDAQLPVQQIPFGTFVNLQNMVQYASGRLSKVAGVYPRGVTIPPNSDIDSYTAVTFGRMKVPGIHGATALRTVVALETSQSLKLYNLDMGFPIVPGSGAALVQNGVGLSSFAFYADQSLFASQRNAIKRIAQDLFHEDMPGTNIPQGYLMQPFYDRLYVAGTLDASGVEEPLVYYTDILTNNFNAFNIVNTSELPGGVTALAINAASTDTSGIDTDLLIFKASSLFVYNEIRKDVLSESIGTEFYKAIANTSAGPMFLGQSKGLRSVFWIPFGQPQAPVDIGRGLIDLLNPVATPIQFAFAFFDGQFFRLHFDTLDNKARNEIWIDTDELARTKEPIWYGVHRRGDFSAGFVYPESGQVQLFRPGVKNRENDANGQFMRWFREINAQNEPTAGALYGEHRDTEGQALISVLDIPLNVDPREEEKEYQKAEIVISPETVAGNSRIETRLLIDDVVLDTRSINLDAKAVELPLAGQGHTATVAKTARLQILHTQDEEFDVEDFALQYEQHEDTRLLGKVRS